MGARCALRAGAASRRTSGGARAGAEKDTVSLLLGAFGRNVSRHNVVVATHRCARDNVVIDDNCRSTRRGRRRGVYSAVRLRRRNSILSCKTGHRSRRRRALGFTAKLLRHPRHDRGDTLLARMLRDGGDMTSAILGRWCSRRGALLRVTRRGAWLLAARSRRVSIVDRAMSARRRRARRRARWSYRG